MTENLGRSIGVGNRTILGHHRRLSGQLEWSAGSYRKM